MVTLVCTQPRPSSLRPCHASGARGDTLARRVSEGNSSSLARLSLGLVFGRESPGVARPARRAALWRQRRLAPHTPQYLVHPGRLHHNIPPVERIVKGIRGSGVFLPAYLANADSGPCYSPNTSCVPDSASGFNFVHGARTYSSLARRTPESRSALYRAMRILSRVLLSPPFQVVDRGSELQPFAAASLDLDSHPAPLWLKSTVPRNPLVAIFIDPGEDGAFGLGSFDPIDRQVWLSRARVGMRIEVPAMRRRRPSDPSLANRAVRPLVPRALVALLVVWLIESAFKAAVDSTIRHCTDLPVRSRSTPVARRRTKSSDTGAILPYPCGKVSRPPARIPKSLMKLLRQPIACNRSSAVADGVACPEGSDGREKRRAAHATPFANAQSVPRAPAGRSRRLGHEGGHKGDKSNFGLKSLSFAQARESEIGLVPARRPTPPNILCTPDGYTTTFPPIERVLRKAKNPLGGFVTPCTVTVYEQLVRFFGVPDLRGMARKPILPRVSPTYIRAYGRT